MFKLKLIYSTFTGQLRKKEILTQAGGTEAVNRSKHNLIKGLASLYRMGLVSAIVSLEVDT